MRRTGFDRLRFAACAMGALALAGCATREVQYHHWPAETPAANNAADIARVQGLHAAAAAASKSVAHEGAPQAADCPGSRRTGAGDTGRCAAADHL